MGKRLLAIFAVVVALGLGTPSLMADHGEKDHKDKAKHANKHDDHDNDKGWERRDGFEFRSYDRGGRPPGWSRGTKTGWGNCGLPPGQAKKYGCRTYVYQGRRHYYYQEDDGRVIVRRPVVALHGSVDIIR